MLSNYLRTAFRFLKYNKVFAGINIMGLSIALAASFIILLYVINEMSYNDYHKNRKRIYRVLNSYLEFKTTNAGTPYVLASTLKEEFPQIEKAAGVRFMRGFRLKLDNEVIGVNDAIATSSDIFSIFTLPLIGGSTQGDLLDNKNSIVLSRELAEKLFPGEMPVGKEIIGVVDGTDQLFTITGVFEDIPVNSTFRTSCLLNGKWTLDPINQTFKVTNADVNWNFDFWNTYILLSKGSDPQSIEKQFRDFEFKHMGKTPNNEVGIQKEFSLQNFSDVYLKSDNVQNSGMKGNISNVRLFSAIAFLILLVAAINYIILATAVSSSRSKEIGIRKTMGASIENIRKQLLSESLLLALIVLPLAILLMSFALPYAAKLFQTRLNIINSNIPIYASVYFALTILIGLASGIYTSAYLSRLKVVGILQNATYPGKKKQVIRSILIVIQLVIFCSFVASTLTIRSQYLYALNKETGYYTSDIIVVELGRDFKGYSSYINNIRTNPNVIMAGGVMNGLPMQGSATSMFSNSQDNTVKVKVEHLAVDYNFIKTMGIEILKGREFSEEYGSDLTQSVMLNEAAVKALGITNPLEYNIGSSKYPQNVIGVVKDFNLHSIHSDIPPLSIGMTDKYIQQVAVHYKPGTLKSILPMLETEWKKAAPDRPFRYFTIEELIKDIYSSEKNLSTIITIFALFTLLIAALGLFGLILFVAKSRTKEIGIKKVFGSSEMAIVNSFLSGNFILITIASLVSIPVTIYFMTKWLNNFAFKVSISGWVFVIAFAVGAIVVLATVFFHSVKAARTNPVKALRYE